MVKKGNFNRAPLGCFFKIYRYRYTDLLLEVKFYFVSEHLPDDSDKLAGTVPKCIVVRPAFSPLGIIISLEGCVVPDNVPSCLLLQAWILLFISLVTFRLRQQGCPNVALVFYDMLL